MQVYDVRAGSACHGVSRACCVACCSWNFIRLLTGQQPDISLCVLHGIVCDEAAGGRQV